MESSVRVINEEKARLTKISLEMQHDREKLEADRNLLGEWPDSEFIVVRSPFREEHLVVVPNFFFWVYMPTQRRHPPFVPCPMSHVPSCPPPIGVIGGQWCWPGTIGQLVHIVWLCTHIYGISAKTSPFCPCPMSRHAPPL